MPAKHSAPCLHPGGLSLTEELLAMLPLPHGAKVADIGCGQGSSVEYFRNNHQLCATGIEKSPTLPISQNVLQADATQLPFTSSSLDAVFFECSLSKIEDAGAAIAEAYRVLKSGGALYIQDMYARGEEQKFSGLLGRMENLAHIQKRFSVAGFAPYCHQDASQHLSSYWAQLLFESDIDLTAALPSKEELRRVQCGYFLAVWLKPSPSPLYRWVSAQVEASEDISPTELHDWQMRKAAKTLDYAKKNSSFFRSHFSGYSGADVLKSNNIAMLPFTTPDQLAENASRMLCLPLGQIQRIRTLQTSGSTGVAKRIYFSENDLARTVDFFAVGMRPMLANDKPVGIMLSTDSPDSIADLLSQGLARINVSSTIYGSFASGAWASESEFSKFQCFVGIAAEMLYLCKSMPNLRPHSILLSADYVPDSVCKALEDTWGCKVFTHYGLTETGYGLAVQCTALGGHHMRLADYFVEIVDPISGEVLPDGTQGEIVLTSLKNEALPLVRYRTGDISQILPTACACGCPLPQLGKISGRVSNFSASCNIHKLDEIVFSDPAVHAFSATTSGETLTLSVCGSTLQKNTIRMAEAAMGCRIAVEYVKTPPKEAMGKRQIFR